jgi:lysine N6-hydroxylase
MSGDCHGHDSVHDFVAIGIGPFNLGLACLTEPLDDLDGVFLERRAEFDWHPGMMLPTAHLQTPFMADLVTLADPTSPFSFLNYVKEAGHMYSFYIRESFHPLRSEYNDYCRWAADKLDCLRFGRDVTSVRYDDGVYSVETSTGETYRGRHLVLGTGTPPHIPAGALPLNANAVHSCDYLSAKEALQATGSIAVIGGGQSAAEIFQDLLEEVDDHDYALTWVTRSPRFFPLEYTKLTLEMTSPEYTDYFHRLPPPVRDDLVKSQAGLYKGIDSELIDDIFNTLYRKHRQGSPKTTLLTNTELVRATYDETSARYDLDLRHLEQQCDFGLTSESLVFATGFRPHVPAFLEGIAGRIDWDDQGRPDVKRNYTIDSNGGEIFVQNGELHTHGFVAPDLGMAAYRNSWIIRELLGEERYAIEESIAFQQFGAPAGMAVAS